MKTTALYLAALLVGSGACAAELEKLDWLTGHWVSADGAYEETWLAPAAGTMVGSFRWVFADGRQVLEFLVIEETDGEVHLRFKHFNPDYEPWEKLAPNTYRLDDSGSNQVTFVRVSDNTDVPYALTYRRQGERLSFIGTGEPGSAEAPLKLEFELR